MRIRGLFLKDYVRRVHELSHLEWDRFLTPEDWEIVNSTIIPTEWYPVETMAHIGQGIFEMVSKNNYGLVRLHGRARVDEIYDDAARKFLIKGDPAGSMRSFVSIAGRFVDEVEVKFEGAANGVAEVSFWPVDDAPAWDLFREIQAGTMEALIELNGGKNASAEFIEITRDGRGGCIIRVNWKTEEG